MPDVSGALVWRRLRAWVLHYSADYPAAQTGLPFMEGVTAHCFCRGCNYDQRRAAADAPFSFLRPVHGSPSWKLRRWEPLRCAVPVAACVV